MSSWFHSVTSLWTGGNAEEHSDEPGPSGQTAESVSSPTEAINRALDELSQQQRETIQEVLRRAEQSRKSVKVVVDGRRLEKLREASVSFDADDIQRQDSHERSHHLVQMDSIPEGVTVHPAESSSDIQVESAKSPEHVHAPGKRNFVSNRMKLISTHIAQWFNTLDYDGDYMSFGFPTGNVPFEGATLDPLTLSYIDALSSGIVIAACIEMCTEELKKSAKFQDYCQDLCETIFNLAYSQIELACIEDSTIRQLDGYCADVALNVIQTVFYTILEQSVQQFVGTCTSPSSLVRSHKQKSFNSASELDDFLERISEEEPDDISSESSEEEEDEAFCYEVLLLDSVLIANQRETTRQIQQKDETLEDETSSDSSIISVVERRTNYSTGSVQIIIRPPTPPPRPPPPRSVLLNTGEKGTMEELNKIRTVYAHTIFHQMYTAALEEYKKYVKNKNLYQKGEGKHENFFNEIEHQELARTVWETNNVDYVLQTDELRTVSNVILCKTSISANAFDSQKPEFTQKEEKVAEDHSSATSGADDAGSFDHSSVDAASFDQPSFDHTFAYGKSSPLLETVEDAEVPEDVSQVAPPVLLEEQPLSQEELAHIAFIQRLAEQSSFDKPQRPEPPVRQNELLAGGTEYFKEEEVAEEHSSATSGADDAGSFDHSSVDAASFDQPSFDHTFVYGKSSPLLETVEDAEVPEEVSQVAPPVLLEEQPLSQEELDHIAFIQRLAEQSSFDKPLRPEPPVRQNELLAGGTEDFEEKEVAEEHSSATSGADDAASFDHSFVNAASFDQPSFDHTFAYGTSSQLLETVKDAKVPEEVSQVAPPVLLEEQPLSQEELDHIAFIQRLAEQSSFDKPQRPEPPVRQNELLAGGTEYFEEKEVAEEHSSATSGADDAGSFDHSSVDAASFDQPSFDHTFVYGKSSPLLETVEDAEVPEEVSQVAPPVLLEEQPLSQEELDHIAFIQRLAEQSSFDKPLRPEPPVRQNELLAGGTEDFEEKEVAEEHSSATSGADDAASFDHSFVNAASFDQPSFDHTFAYGTSSQLLETVKDAKVPEEVSQVAPPVLLEEQPLSQEELDHIAFIQRLAEQSSFDKPQRPEPPVRQNELLAGGTEYFEEKEVAEEHSSATSGADDAGSFDHSSVDAASFDQPSFDHTFVYGKSSPLLETVEDAEVPEEVSQVAPPVLLEEQPLSQEELDHIAFIQRLAEQSSFDKPLRPEPPVRQNELLAGGTEDFEEKEVAEEHSSATSGADDAASFDHSFVNAASFDQPSFDHTFAYGTSSQLLETVKDAKVPEEVSQVAPPVLLEEQPLSQEELDYIAFIQRLAEQSSFDKPQRPEPPVRQNELLAGGTEYFKEEEVAEEHSSATSGADDAGSFDHSSVDAASFDQPSFDHTFAYGKSSPLLETVEDAEVPEDVSQVAPPVLLEEQPLSQEELDHIAFIQRLAEQSSFDKPQRPEPPIRQNELLAGGTADFEEEEVAEEHSSATSGADDAGSFDHSSVDAASFDQPSFDHTFAYGKSSPLLETVEDAEVPEDVSQVAPPVLLEEQPLSQEELDHIAFIQRLAEQSSFDKPQRPEPPVRQNELLAGGTEYFKEEEVAEEHSSATSGADDAGSFDHSSVDAASFDQPSFDHTFAYGKSSPLLETVEDAEVPEDVSQVAPPVLLEEQPLSQEELDHIAFIQRLAEQSSFDKPQRPEPPIRQNELLAGGTADFEEEEVAEDHSSATSGADDAGLFDHSSVEAASFDQPSFDHTFAYGKSSPLLETVEDAEVPEDVSQVAPPVLLEEQPLSQEELDHIAFIQRLAEQSSFDKPQRPEPPIRQNELLAGGTEYFKEEEVAEEHSSATSGADDAGSFDHSSVDAASFDQPSFDHTFAYGTSSPLLETVEDAKVPEEVSQVAPPVLLEEQPLSQEELDHIAFIQRLAEQSSFDKPQRPEPHVRQNELLSGGTGDFEEEEVAEDHSSATSGADDAGSFDHSSVDAASFDQPSIDHTFAYGKSSPLLETVENAEVPEEVSQVAPPVLLEEQPLSQEELDHIAFIQRLAEQSSFDKPQRPEQHVRQNELLAGGTEDLEEKEVAEDHSSATSGADDAGSFDHSSVDAASFDQPSFDHTFAYGKSSPLLETVEDAEVPEDVSQVAPPVLLEEQPLSQEELDHIAFIQRLAEQSSFDKPQRPEPPIRQNELLAGGTEYFEEEEVAEEHSSATSGADDAGSFDHSSVDAASFDQPSFDHTFAYGKSSPLLETVEDAEVPEEVSQVAPPVLLEEQPLSQEELDHIAFIQRLAEQSSFDKPQRPEPPVHQNELLAGGTENFEEEEVAEEHSSATSGADDAGSFDHSSVDAAFFDQPSFDHTFAYGKSSPLLETVEDAEVPEEVSQVAPPVLLEEQPLSQEELDHIAFIQRLAEQSSFDKPQRPEPHVRQNDLLAGGTEDFEEEEVAEDHSSATSGADDAGSFDHSSVDAASFDQPSFDHTFAYEKSSPLLKTVEDAEVPEEVSQVAPPVLLEEQPLSQEELDHIAFIQRLAEQSSFDKPQRPEPHVRQNELLAGGTEDFEEEEVAEEHSSATSGADDAGSFDHSSVDAASFDQPSIDHTFAYGKSSPLLETVENAEVPEEVSQVAPPVLLEEQPLSQEELDHIAFIQRLAEQSSFDKPQRPEPHVRQNELLAGGTEEFEKEEVAEDHSIATSGADDAGSFNQSSVDAASFDQASFDHTFAYGKSSPLLETVEDAEVPEEVSQVAPPVLLEEQPLSQEELDHIAFIQRLAEQSSFDKPQRPEPHVRQNELLAGGTEDFEEEEVAEEHSSATSGADDAGSFDHSSVDAASFDQPSIDHTFAYGKSSPLLETVENAEVPEEVSQVAPPVLLEEQPLSQEELDHIAFIQRLAEQSSFDKPQRPEPHVRQNELLAGGTEEFEKEEVAEDHSSATSGADDAGSFDHSSVDAASFDQPSFDHTFAYGTSSPLLETVEDAKVPEEVSQVAPPVLLEEQPLSQEELDHIAFIQRLAEQSSFDKPQRPEPHVRQNDLLAGGTEDFEEEEVAEDHSSATSGADDAGSFDHSSVDAASFDQTSFDHTFAYGKSSPLLETVEDAEVPEKVSQVAPPVLLEEQPLSQEELDHIAFIQRLAEQSSFDKPQRPEPHVRQNELLSGGTEDFEEEEVAEEHSSATSGADDAGSFDHSSVDAASFDQPSFDHTFAYGKSSPLLETVEDAEVPEEVSQVAPPVLLEEQPLSQEELDHIAFIQRLAEQSSFDKPHRPEPPVRQNKLLAGGTEDFEEEEVAEEHSSATSGADDAGSFDHSSVDAASFDQPSFDHTFAYGKSSPLLETVEDAEVPEEVSQVAPPVLLEEQPLSQEELDHIAFIQRLAEQSSFDKPQRPEPHVRQNDLLAGGTEDFEEEEVAEDHSSATSGADDAGSFDHSSVDAAFFDQPSFDHTFAYGKSSPLLETVKDAEVPEEVSQVAPPVLLEEQPLSQEELDHIAFIQRLAEQSSFDKPQRPEPHVRQNELLAGGTEDFEEEEVAEDHSSATSGADDAGSFNHSSVDAASFDQASFDHTFAYGKSSPLLETVEDAEVPEEVSQVAPPVLLEEQPLSQEELDHIAFIQRLAEQSSFDKPQRPEAPVRQNELLAGGTEDFEEEEVAEEHSSATSGADDAGSFDHSSVDAAFDQPSFDHTFAYGTSSPLLETVEDAKVPEEVSQVAPPVLLEEQPLSQEELDHIAFIQRLAEQSSFDKPQRPKPHVRQNDLLAGGTEDFEEEEVAEKHSSATSGADDAGSFDHSSVDAASFDQPSFDHTFAYGKSSPLLETVEDAEVSEEVSQVAPPVLLEEQPLSQEELDHIAFIQRLAEQSSFDKPQRPEPPVRQNELLASGTEDFEEEEVAEEHSSATSGADDAGSFDHSSVDAAFDQPSFDHTFAYGTSSPLLETVEDAKVPEEVSQVAPPVLLEEQPLSQEELDHIAFIQRLAEQSSFDKPQRPKPHVRQNDLLAGGTEDFEEEEVAEEHSSATSGADDAGSFDHSSVDAASFDQPSFDHTFAYGKSSPFLETVEDAEVPEEVSQVAPPVLLEEQPLSQEELDHIAFIQRLAEQSSFDKPQRPEPPVRQNELLASGTEDFEEEEVAEEHSSATSGADDAGSFDHSSVDAAFDQPSFDHTFAYGTSSPLLETVEDAKVPEEVSQVAPPVLLEEQPLSQEELDHIAFIQRLAEQSSFDKPQRPKPHVRQNDLLAGGTEDFEEEEVAEEHSSATSGADDAGSFDHSSVDAASFDQPSFDHTFAYGKSSPFLETVEDAEVPEEVSQVAPPVLLEEQPLSQEELDHIAFIQRLAEQSSFVDRDFEIEKTEEHSNFFSGAPNMYFNKISTEGASKLHNAKEFHKENRKHETLVPINSQEKVLTDLHRMPKQKSLEVYNSSTLFSFPVENVLIRNTASLANSRNNGNPRIRSHSSSEAEQLPSKQSKQSSKTQVSLKQNLVPLVKPIRGSEADPSYCGSPRSLESVRSPLVRSLSDICLEASPDLLRKDVLRASASTSCVSNKCSSLHKRLNAFELCEQHSFTQSRDLLCNVDFLCRLNFVANRMTEDVAEAAGSELRAFYRSQTNPRARYFTEYPLHGRSMSEDSESDARSGVNFTVKPAEVQPLTTNFLKLFGGKRSTASTLSWFQQDPRINGSRKVSEQPASRKVSDGSEILNLLRRSSGADSRALTESPLRLPDNALIGLSNEEREHVMTVLQKSTRSQSPSVSRRPSSALQVLPELENISDAEREHIQSVLERANSPFTLRAQKLSRTASPDIPRRIQEEAMANDAMRQVELHKQRQKASEREEATMTLTPETAIVIESARETKNLLGEAAKTFEEQPPPQMIGSVPSSLSTPPATALKSFFGKAKDSVKNVTTVIAKEAKVVVGSPGNDLDHLARIQRLADHFLPGEHLKEAVSRKQTQGSEGGLTQEELEHIRNVAAMADKELGLPSSRSEEKKPLRKQQSVTKEKLEHIERTTAMAAQEEISSCERRTSAVQEPMKKAKDATTVASFANRFNPFDRKVEEELKKNQKREKDLVEPVGLTDEEMEHIKKIASMADRETASFENFRKSESQRRITPDNVPDTVSSKASHTLTEEETEHIRRVAAMAAEDAQPPQNVKVGNELSAKEIEHIQRIAATAENDASRTQLWTPKVSISKQAADELTEEEMEHIRRITELAEMETGEPFPKATRRDFDSTSASSNRTSVTQTKEKKEELTAEEMEHIARIAALAEQDVLEKLAKEEPDITAYVSPLVTDEELEHTRKITEMTEKDLKQPQQRLSVFEEKLVSQTPELTEEELEHIRRVTEMAEEDYARHTSPEQPKYETVWKGDAGFSHPSADDGKFYEFGRVIQTTHKPSEVELTAEEFEHIRRIEEMANFDQEKTSFSGQPYSEHPSLEEIYRVVTPSVMTDSGSSDNSMPDAGKLQEEEEIQQPSTTNEYPTDLTEEELEHIRRVTAMAEQIGPDEFFVTPKYTNSVRMESGQSELTEEELEHIRRVTAMADQINSYDAQMVEPQKTFDRREHEELAPATGNLTAEELEHIRRITSMAEDFRGPFDSYSQLPQVIMKTPVKSKDGLTAEELEHIRKIEAMANMDSQEEFSGANAQTVGQQVPHDNFIPIPNTPDLETAVSLAPKYGELEESLTVEEMEHIRRVEAMASGTYEAYEENEFQGDQYGSEDFDRRSLEEADKPWAENADILQYDDEQDQLEDIGHEKVEEVERASEEESEPDTSEELDSRILDRWSPKEDGEWKGETANERGESFEIKEVQEMPRDETLEKWYDEQLSHLRESMADEDDEEEVDSWSPQEETFTEQSPPYSQPDRRPSDALHIATLAPASLTPFVTPLTEQPSGPISSPAQSLFSGWPSRIDRPSSPMSTAAQAGRFRLSGLGKFAAGAFEKAKKAGEQLQAAADPSRPPPAAAESEEERLRREAVEACARLDAVAPPSPMAPPLGMEGLSAEEQRQIMAVLAEAEADSAPSPRPPSTPQAPPPAMMPSTSRGSFAPSPQPPPSTSPIPSGLEELSEEEQRRIMAVIAQAEAMDAAEPPRPPSRRESAHMAPITPTAPAGQEIPPGLEELSQEERNRILAVIANAEMSIGQEPPQVVHQPEPLPAVFPTDKSLGGFPSTDSEPPSEAVSVSEPSDWVDPSSFEYRRPSAAIPRTTQLPLGPATETCVDADLSPREEQQPKERRRSSSGVRQPSLTSSSGSPVRESGYGTASTSFATELGDFAYKPSTLLDETMDQREGARSRNGSRADEVDDDFTYSDQRFSELNDDELFHVTQHDEESVTVDAVEAPLPWRGGRMWTTVFEGDEAHREPAHASPTDAVDMDEVYDNFLKGGTVLQEIAFDSTPRRVEEPSERKKSGEMKPPPEIMVTVHEDRRSDSEEEESGSEDDDEYPDRVVAAPVAAPPSFEDVERERLQQEQFGKEVLQQIQAFGESANDEFDVQWAKVALAASKDNKVTPTSVELSTQPSEQPLDVSSAQRKNPFLDSPEEEDVSVDMEELDLTTAARIYQGVLTTPSHRPVYTIPEDDSEDDGAKTNTDSRLHAREKRRIAARSVADHIIQLSSQGDQAQPTTCHSAVVSNPQQATTVETIICTVSPLLYTSSYLFSTAPFVLPTSSPPTFTSPSTTVSEAEKRAAALNSSIDKTLSDIHHLLDTCSVYSSEKSKPNLLCYTGTAFENKNVLLPSEEVTSCSPSPSFLLPLSATLGQGLEEEESPSHGLRRSPGMMLPAEKSEPLAPEMSSIFETAMEKTTQRKEEDDVPAAVQDMGRRKLPSIPSQPAYSTTATYPAPPPGAYIVPHIESEPQRLSRSAPAPVYLSSSAPSVSTSSIPTYTAFSASGTQTLPNGSAITDRPSTSMSWTSTASTSKARDPAILPGAAFHVKPRIAIRQPVSSVIGRKAGGSKIPNTLARVLLKKELKEALSRRKETLEACEIEANQRQYVVHRMLVTGLLPEGREDDTPKVIPCLLPVELINGARVIPKKTCSVATQKSEDDMFPPKYVEPPTPKPPPHARASVAVQMDEPLRPSTSLRAQLRPFMQKRVAETQTDFTSLPFCRETTLDRERLSRRDQHDATCQTTDLLEATRKYFEDYDRKLKELGSRTKRQHHRHHFEFHDDEDALTREERRNQLSEELHRRRERLWASTELPSYDGAGAGISDYSRDYQHYGSLPRFDRSQAPRDFTVREQPVYGGSQQPYSYASLPRNYERILAPAPLEPIQIEYEQSFGGRPYGGGGGQQTRSMLDLHGGYDHLSYPQEERSSRGRSMTYLDQMEDLPRRMEDPRRLYPRTFDLHGRHYAQDTTNCALPGEPDLLSQYATYLQREFQPTLMAAEPRQQHLRQPLSDPYRFSYQQPPEAYGTLPAGYGMQTAGYGTLPSAKPAIRPQRYEAPLSDPYSAPAEVYSRSENNYGARPAGFSLDYGNLQRRAPLYRNQEDALSRVYASRRRVADPSPPSQFRFRSLGNLASAMPSSAAVASPRPQTTKRLLLTRCYRDHNIYNDLGVRVVGGKRLRDGTLGAFVSAVNQSKFNQTLGEIRPGDQVLEWNGVLLSGKTFEEVERVVNASSGEVEVVVRCGEGEYGSTVHEEQTRGIMTRTTERNISPDRRPPVPMHRKQNARIYDCVDTLRNTRKSESGDLGHLQVAAFYDQRMSKLIVRVQSARGLKMRDLSTRSLPNPFVKIYLLPGRKVSHKRRTRFVPCSVNPEWNQQVDYDVPSTTLSAHCVELSIWDYDKFSENNALGRVLIPLSDASVLSGVPRWYPVEALDARLARSHLNAPLERHMTAANNYVPALLDIGYPAID